MNIRGSVSQGDFFKMAEQNRLVQAPEPEMSGIKLVAIVKSGRTKPRGTKRPPAKPPDEPEHILIPTRELTR